MDRDEIVELMLRIEDKSLSVEQIATWLKRHAKRPQQSCENKEANGEKHL